MFLECTSTHASRYNTGIQRAVRNLVSASLAIDSQRCTAIVYNGRYFEPIAALPGELPRHRAMAARPDAVDRLRRAFHRVRCGIVRALPSPAVRGALFSQRLEYALRRMVYAAQNARGWAGSFRAGRGPRIGFRHGDVLVLLDSTWSIDLSNELSRAKTAGARIWVVVNDLIPLQYPELAPEGTPILLAKWLRRTVPYADGLVGISRAVADSLRAQLVTIGIAGELPRIEHFYLGAGFDAPVSDRARLAAVAAAFSEPIGSAYLVVGTIEPRKGYAQILDAFERLWAGGVDSRLVIFGRHGWRSEELVQRIRRHREFGRRLIWFDAGSDAELDFAYRRASALIFASRCEGFGLPLAEAMQYGLPVIASDIPVFREIGGDYPRYFGLGRAESLFEAIRDFETERATGAVPRAPRPWLTWQDSARMLLRTVTGAARLDA